MSAPEPLGLVAEFARPDDLAAAVRRLHAAGFRHIEAYTPFPVPEIEALLATREWVLPVVIFVFGFLGLIISYFMQYWAAAVNFPINVGGRPLNSWPAFGPITFEITVLWAVASGFFACIIALRLPRLSTPIASVPGFERATRDRFFLAVEAADPRYEEGRVRWLLGHFGPERISVVPP